MLLIIEITSTVNVKQLLVRLSRLLPRQQPKCVTVYAAEFSIFQKSDHSLNYFILKIFNKNFSVKCLKFPILLGIHECRYACEKRMDLHSIVLLRSSIFMMLIDH